MINILDSFRLDEEKEDLEKVIDNIDNGVIFRGTNLWILVFAIFIASLGLNVNSTAVVIGAMLVSPLMGPIMGLGIGMAINDLVLLRKALYNYLFALVVGLTTSTVFFALSPLNDASSEILSRTSPNIYDVLIALFGGFAGILAVSSRKKGTVIPGVAIATALMPPLCTAGYGIANWNLAFFTGALYLFLINTVFIALATLLTARFLHFPIKHLPEPRDELIAKRIVWGIVTITLLPSIYFGYDIVQQNRFRQRAEQFVTNEAVFPNDYLLKKNINAKKYEITLTYGGEPIRDDEIESLRRKLPEYKLDGARLQVLQGFAYLKDNNEDERTKQLTAALNEKETQIRNLKSQVDAITAENALGQQIFSELKVQYPQIDSCIVQQAVNHAETDQVKIWIAIIHSKQKVTDNERQKIEEWLKVRLKTDQIIMSYENGDFIKSD